MDFPAWDPVLIDIPGLPIAIRWYGLMYVVGFIVGQWLLVRLARARFLPVAEDKAPDLVLYLVFGVLLGGRVGYALFYEHDLLSPLKFIRVWAGGLSFHGGLLGVCIAAILFARKHKIAILRVFDACALAVTPGILAVRMANFINGELYGRVTEAGVGWAMRFPGDPKAMELLHLQDSWSMRERELCIQVAFKHRSWDGVKGMLSDTDEHGQHIDWERDVRPFLDWDRIKDQVPFRHPSQLYEGLGEGVVVGIVLLVVYLLTRRRPLRAGAYGGVFLIGYAVVRFCIEYLREPDKQFKSLTNPVGTVFLSMTMGQTLCAVMAVAGLLMLFWPRRAPPPPATEAKT